MKSIKKKYINRLALLVTTILGSTVLAESSLAESANDFIGHYKAIGVCKLIRGNRTMVRMEIKPAEAWANLPPGSMLVTFHRYEEFNTDYFSTYVIPGSGTVKVPESSDKYPVQMTYSTEIENSISSQNTHHESTRERIESLTLSPSALGGPIWDLEYTAGWYEPLDKCQFVKASKS